MELENKKNLIKRMLEPECIAVIGATPDNMWTRNLLGGLEREGYRGRLYTINRGRGKVLGYPCYPKVAELPEAPDLAMILVSAKYVFDTLRELAEKGCAAAYVLAAGYEEHDKLEELRKVANDLGILILGPNCNGYVRPDSGLHCWGGPIPRPYKAGSLAFIAQSSAVAVSAANSCWDRNLGFYDPIPVCTAGVGQFPGLIKRGRWRLSPKAVLWPAQRPTPAGIEISAFQPLSPPAIRPTSRWRTAWIILLTTSIPAPSSVTSNNSAISRSSLVGSNGVVTQEKR